MALRPCLAILAYNQEKFIADALRSALRQDCPSYDLIIADDASPDRTREVVEEVLATEHPSHVRVIRLYQPANIGMLASVNAIFAACEADVLMFMGGDDVSLPGRLSAAMAVFEANPEVMLFSSNFQKIDDKGRFLSEPINRSPTRQFFHDPAGARRIYAKSPVCGATGAYRRELFQVFGPMIPGPHAEDNCYWVRALILGRIHYDARPLILWRQHEGSASNYSPTNEISTEWQALHLAWMERHTRMGPQWETDIQKAEQTGRLSVAAAASMRRAADRDTAQWTLEFASLGVAPWSRWCAAVRPVLGQGRWGFALKMFRIRLFKRRRERHWRVWVEIKRK